MTDYFRKFKTALLLTGAATVLCLSVSANAKADEIYYSNDLGLILSYKEYAYLSQFMDDMDLALFTQEEADYLIEHIAEDGVETDAKYIKTEVSTADGSVLSEVYMSEEEMFGELNGTCITISDNVEATAGTDAYDPSKRYAETTTDMRKLVLNMYSVGASVKK
ncbi:MAG: hypothetical protein NC223_08335 [Butyrivibrio sp.]|nr:hypothetical protein [Butyrivibrio sp.]